MIDIANSTINFTLDIFPEGVTTVGPGAGDVLNPLVLSGSAADLFAVESVYWNGTLLTL